MVLFLQAVQRAAPGLLATVLVIAPHAASMPMEGDGQNGV